MKQTTDVKLHTCGNDLTCRWYISVMYTASNGKRKRRQVYLGLNYEKTISKRTKEGFRLIKFVNDQLKNGWDPERCDIEDFISGNYVSPSDNQSEMSFTKALTFGLEKGSWAKKTKLDFSCTAEFFKTAAENIGLKNKPIDAICRRDIKLMADNIKKNRGWSNKAYNKNIVYLSAILSQLVSYEIIDHNPCSKIKPLAETEDVHYEPLTTGEKIKLQEHLFLHHYHFYVYLMVIYYTGIRPKEVLSLRIRDINLDKREIVIKPDLVEENSKTKKIRYIPISDNLFLFLQQMSLQDYPETYFVFGSPANSGHGKKGSITAMNPSYFTPFPTKIKRDTATRLWKALVMAPEKEGGLGIKKHMYGMKHTGADDYILNGVHIDALKSMYGHSSIFMTEKYVSKIKEVYKNEIIKHSPKF